MTPQAQAHDEWAHDMEQEDRGNFALLRLVLCAALSMTFIGLASQLIA